MTHSSGRVFILWARALCFLASRLTTVSLDHLYDTCEPGMVAVVLLVSLHMVYLLMMAINM